MQNKNNYDIKAVESLIDLSLLGKYFCELSPQAMVIVEGKTHLVLSVNSAFLQLVQKERNQLLGHPFAECVPEGSNNGCLALLDRVFATGEPEVLLEQKHVEKLLSIYWSYSVWAILGTNDIPAGVIIQIAESTETATYRINSTLLNKELLIAGIKQHELTAAAEQLSDQLLNATQAKNQFFATMSHELRTPLNAIIGFSDLLLSPHQNATDTLEYIKRMQSNALLLSRLIDDILEISKNDAGKLTIEKIEVNIQEIISDVFAVMKHKANEKGISFAMRKPYPLPATIISDPTRIKQILTNVIGNAIKFTTCGEVNVTFTVDSPNKMLRILVSDTGEGIEPEHAKTIFLPFVQADSSIRRKFGGTGLGLNLALVLAQALGGNVELLTSTTGKGSDFEITLVLENPKFKVAQGEPGAVVPEKIIRLDGLNILLAEDALDNQFLMTKILNISGAKVDIANDGQEAFEKTQLKHYDLILMDIQMPKLCGREATLKIREHGYKGPIIAQTAHAMGDEIELCLKAGCNAHIAKPIDRKKLIEMIHQLYHSH